MELHIVQRGVAAAKIGRARAWLNDVVPVLLGSQQSFLTDPARRDLALFYLFLAAITSAASIDMP